MRSFLFLGESGCGLTSRLQVISYYEFYLVNKTISPNSGLEPGTSIFPGHPAGKLDVLVPRPEVGRMILFTNLNLS